MYDIYKPPAIISSWFFSSLICSLKYFINIKNHLTHSIVWKIWIATIFKNGAHGNERCINIYWYFKKGDKPIPQERLDRVKELIEPWFIFSMIWSIGCTGDNDSWTKFSNWVREKMTEMKVGTSIKCFDVMQFQLST